MPSDKLLNSVDADRDLLQRVKGFLHQRGYGPHRTLEIGVERGVVVVQGRVPTNGSLRPLRRDTAWICRTWREQRKTRIDHIFVIAIVFLPQGDN